MRHAVVGILLAAALWTSLPRMTRLVRDAIEALPQTYEERRARVTEALKNSRALATALALRHELAALWERSSASSATRNGGFMSSPGMRATVDRAWREPVVPRADAAVTGAGEALGMVEAGEMRAVGISSPERSEALPDVPSLVEQDIDFTFDIWRGVMAPADLEEAQVAYYESLFADLVETQAWQEESARLGWTDAYMGSEDFGAFLDETRDEFAEILTEVGLQ